LAGSDFGTVRMLEKKVGIQMGFLTRIAGCKGRVYFQTGLFRRGWRLGAGLAMGVVG
jgi:hypothetical protein